MSPAQKLIDRVFLTKTNWPAEDLADDWRAEVGPPGQGKSQFMAQIARDLELPLIIVPLADGRQAEQVEKLAFFRQRIAACWDFCPAAVREKMVSKQFPRVSARGKASRLASPVAKVISRMPYERVVQINPTAAHRLVWTLFM